MFQYFLTISSLLLLLNLSICVCIAIFYDLSPILFAVVELIRKCKFPTTHTVHRYTGYVFVCVCRCVRTSVHVTKPPLTQSMTPFFLTYVLYSVLMYLYSLNSSYTPCVCMCIYAHQHVCTYLCTYMCVVISNISQHPTQYVCSIL